MPTRIYESETEVEELAESNGFPLGARIRDNDGLNFIVGYHLGQLLAYRVLVSNDAPDLHAADVVDFCDLRLPLYVTTEEK